MACSPEVADSPAPESVSPGARPEIVETLREDLIAARHPGDGGGRAWLEPISSADEASIERAAVDVASLEVGSIGASELGSWEVVYEAGPEGIAVGGMLFLQVSPFWGWSPAQVWDPRAPGFSTVQTSAAGVELSPVSFDQGLFALRVGGRALAAGERVRIRYGAGSVGALADRYAESASRFWVAVDADGDGVRRLIATSPSIDVVAGPPKRLVVHLPSTGGSGDTVRLTVALLDEVGNAGFPASESIALKASTDGVLALPATLRLEPDDRGRSTIELSVLHSGSVTVEAIASNGLTATSNPLTVAEELPRILWADLHGHSSLSDGTGTPADYFRYAREVAALDAVALTDHDHWGLQPLATHPGLWDEIVEQTAGFHQPGRFVTVLGYEWTNWLHGHRHVLYFEDRGEILSSVDPDYETPTQLWDALRGLPALTFAHHSAGGPIATNWDYPPDPELEPVTEIVSVHGSSEAADTPGPIYSPRSGNYVRNALDRGFELGFIGSGDSHDGHPGLAHLASGSGGLAAIYSEELTRDGILEALRSRRAYATNGPRILLHALLQQQPMGARVDPGDAVLEAKIVATAPLRSVDLVRAGRPIERLPGEARREVDLELPVNDLKAGDFLYLRVVQEDGGAAWSSPWFVR